MKKPAQTAGRPRGLNQFIGVSMTKLIKIDKRNRVKPEGYAIMAGDGWLTIIQGGNGQYSNVVMLHGAELEQFIADLDQATSELAKQTLQEAS